MRVTEAVDEEYQALPGAVKAAIESWVEALAEVDEAAARLLSLGRDSGITRYDLIAVSRRQLVRRFPGRKHGVPL